MLIDKLKQWQYYYKKLPLYMRNSYGIQEHFKMIFDMMIAIDDNEQNICELFDFLQDDYVNNVIAKYDDINGFDFNFLDMIGAIYGVNRTLNVQYYRQSTHTNVNKTLRLNNREYYIFIKSRIIQNNYDGTFEQARQYYEGIGFPLYMFTTIEDDEHATCYMYLGQNENTFDNIRDLYLANLLTLKSVGIIYVLNEIDIYRMAIWADDIIEPNNNNSWDVSVWF